MGRTSKAEEKRSRIVWALFECLARSGHETVTVKDIAAQAGLPHGVIHYYFKKKDDIAAALVDALAQVYGRMFEEALANGAVPDDRVRIMLDSLVDAFVFDRRLNRAFYNLVQMGFERQGVSAPLGRMLGTYRDTIAGVFEAAGAGAQSNGLARLLVALVEGLALQWMIDPGILEKQQVRRLVRQSIPPDTFNKREAT